MWEGVTTHTADALVSQPHGDEERTARDEAIEFLRDALAAGPVAAKEILRQAREAGINEKTLRRAKGDIGVLARKGGFDAGWTWDLPHPEDGHATPEDRHKNGCPPSVPVVHLRDTWQPSEHPDKCRSCTITLKPEELAAGYCGWCKARGKDRAERKDAS
ncbi:hypothetical protein NITHO_6130001 [Nitrolancea hollandica Lb]|uniref:Uncharacterized protein n=1 Tax=Nitrolancea hollandica Lb TaxID=1129897 RepID=I4EMJ7_9BACT|nr:hypothetical protein NITHO_6130001 [Nitrolancea hollandica Lb]